ncbi:hypothetical protein MRBLWH7_001888 [Microbacterium sp. LWH7-1.2]|uniref:hypothetical protein n=1 Tax=Microbacterium sp. LWH7-1.2 TaxID=3135257 RepID=UPI003138D1D7
MHTIDRERAADERPVGFEKAEDAGDVWRFVAESRGDSLNLRLQALHQLRPIAAADAERFDTSPEQKIFSATTTVTIGPIALRGLGLARWASKGDLGSPRSRQNERSREADLVPHG